MFDSSLIDDLRRGPRWSAPRIGLDVAVWLVLAGAAARSGSVLVTAVAVALIGAAPMHDLLFHGHESAHGNFSRAPWLDAVGRWATHAVFGLSGAGYRAFHLEHHRHAHTLADPEHRLMARVAAGAPGWAWLAMPVAAYLAVDVEPLLRGPASLRRRVARDLALAALLHAALVALFGARAWAVFVVLPMATSLAAVVAVRSVAEHHGLAEGGARSVRVGPVLGFLWSNASYHREHHVAPGVPFHRLPELARRLGPARGDDAIEHGYLGLALRLFTEPRHFGGPMRGPDFQLRVRLLEDVLRCPEARRHLWSVYYTGEAYVELHAEGVFTSRLPPRLATRLTRHLADETRHATLFAALLRREGAAPVRVPAEEVVGWFGLTHAVPEFVRGGATGRPFDAAEAARYFAFLHGLRAAEHRRPPRAPRGRAPHRRRRRPRRHRAHPPRRAAARGVHAPRRAPALAVARGRAAPGPARRAPRLRRLAAATRRALRRPRRAPADALGKAALDRAGRARGARSRRAAAAGLRADAARLREAVRS